VDRERAEIYLRLVAEAELRRAATLPGDRVVSLPDRPGADRGALVVRQRSAVAAALYDLPIRQREVIALQFYGNLSEAQAAATAGLSRGAVHSLTAHGMSALQAALEAGTSRVAQVAQVLTAVGALGHEVADQILDEFALALGTRQAGSAGRRSPDPRSLLRSPAAHLPLGMLMSTLPSAPPVRAAAGSFTTVPAGAPGSAVSRTTAYRAIPVGQMIPVRARDSAPWGEDVSGEMYLLSYAQTAPGALLTMVARSRGEFAPPDVEPSGNYQPCGTFPADRFTATDDKGTSYRMTFSGRGGRHPSELAGQITLHPAPPPDIRWLDLATTPGEPAVRIDLAPANRRPDGTVVTVRQAVTSPGEHLMHNLATRLLLLVLAFPHEIRLHPAALRPGPVTYIADGLGEVIAALEACGALPPLSPVPGQLAALCAKLNVTGHGITARPTRGLPEPWLSMLAHYHRRKPGRVLGRDGCAAVAVAFPELDRIRLAILGLHNSVDTTFLHVHAGGMTLDGHDGPHSTEPGFPLRIWVRDSAGRWHATRTGWSAEDDSGVMMRLQVVPPLSRATAWIEVLATGQSADAHATLPLCWQ
jgi:Sigma-70, region 4